MITKAIKTSVIAAATCTLLAGALLADSLWSNVTIADTLRPDYLILDGTDVKSDRTFVAEHPETVEVEMVKDWVETLRVRPSRCF